MLTIFQNSKQILNWRFKLEKGTFSGNLYFQNYFEFCTETSKTQNTKVVHLDKIYNFSFELNSKFCLVFELHKRGKSWVLKLGFFPPLALGKLSPKDFKHQHKHPNTI